MCWWFVYSMFFNSGNDAASFLELVESEYFLTSLSVWFWSSCTNFLFACGTFYCRLAWKYPTYAGCTRCLDACTTLFLTSAFSWLTRDPKLRAVISSLLCSHSARHGFALVVGEPSFEVVFWPLFDMELPEYIEKFKIVNKRRRWSHSSFEKLPLVSISVSWFFGVNKIDLDFWVWNWFWCWNEQ